jgi:hypothetical protein
MNGTPGRSARTIAAILLAALAVAACASASAPVDTTRDGAFVAAPTAAPAPADQGMTTAESGSAAGAGGAAPVDGQQGAANAGSNAADQLLVIKTGNLILQVDDIATALVKARGVIAGLGGYVSGSDEANEGERHVAVITYRIPAARWDEAIDALRTLATKVIGEKTNAVEVTGQVRDLGAQITNLQASEQALQAIMAKATKISDILEVQAQLTDVRGQIEQLETEKQHLEEQAANGTLAVTFETPIVAVEEVKQGWNLGDEIDRAAAQLVSVGQGLASGLVWLLIVVLPVLLAAGIVLLIVLAPLAFILRRISRRIVRPHSPMWSPAVTAPAWGPASSGSAAVARTTDAPPSVVQPAEPVSPTPGGTGPNVPPGA